MLFTMVPIRSNPIIEIKMKFEDKRKYLRIISRHNIRPYYLLNSIKLLYLRRSASKLCQIDIELIEFHVSSTSRLDSFLTVTRVRRRKAF